METKQEIENILQKHGVATKMTVTTGSTSDAIPEYHTQEVATGLIEELTALITKKTRKEQEAVRGFASELMRKDGWLHGLEMDIVGLRDKVDNGEEITNWYEQLEFLRVQVAKVKYFVEEYTEQYLTQKEYR